MFDVCKTIRSFAQNALYQSLEELLSKKTPFSEIELRDLWLKRLRKNPSLLSDGWYDPPPHGLIVMLATPRDISRLNEKSYRSEICWPRSDIFFDSENSILLLHASPVDKMTGVTGDFGITLYVGKDKSLQKHLKTSLLINRQIADYAYEGMAFAEITKFAQTIISHHHLISDLSSPSDPTGTNIGHIIPATSPTWNEHAFIKARDNSQQAINDFIRQQRVFLNTKEQTRLKSGMGITIEPRPWSKNLPPGYFHSLLFVKDNVEKEYIEGFNDLFKLAGMDYMLNS